MLMKEILLIIILIIFLSLIKNILISFYKGMKKSLLQRVIYLKNSKNINYIQIFPLQ